MKLIRVVVSDLHLGTGIREGVPNPFEDFLFDDRFAELVAYYDELAGADTEFELILNGDIFDLLKVKVGGIWPHEITDDIAAEKLRQCLDGHPRFVRALHDLMRRGNRRITYLPGNHDLDMWFPGPQQLFRRYVAPPGAAERVRFITESDTYSLPEGIQIRHGHQLERIHRVDYGEMTYKRRDGAEILDIPWGSLWILEVMNPAKEQRAYVDRIQPLGRFLLGAMLFDAKFAFSFMFRTSVYFLRRRIFTLKAWRDRIRYLPMRLREEILSLGSYDDLAIRDLKRVRGVHTLIVGHSHGPRFRQIAHNKLLINTGTWMRMVNLDIQFLGQDSGLTYALIDYDDNGKARPRLMKWIGRQLPYEPIPYAE